MRNKSATVSCHESKAFDIKAYAWDSHLKAKYETWQLKQNIKIWFEYTQHGTCLSDGWNTDCPFCQESSAKSKLT